MTLRMYDGNQTLAIVSHVRDTRIAPLFGLSRVLVAVRGLTKQLACISGQNGLLEAQRSKLYGSGGTYRQQVCHVCRPYAEISSLAASSTTTLSTPPSYKLPILQSKYLLELSEDMMRCSSVGKLGTYRCGFVAQRVSEQQLLYGRIFADRRFESPRLSEGLSCSARNMLEFFQSLSRN